MGDMAINILFNELYLKFEIHLISFHFIFSGGEAKDIQKQ